MVLCKTAVDLDKACKVLKLKHYDEFPKSGADCRLISYKDQPLCIVCVASVKGFSKHQINALLCHEAVHVWQYFCDDIGEKNPGIETEAYSIQKITQNLMEEFWDKK